LQAITLLACISGAALGHDPARAFAIKGDVEAAVVDGNVAA
jgi:hypothetical protein